MGELIGIREAGRRLGVSDTSVRKAIASGRVSVAGRTDSGRPLLDWDAVQANWGNVDPARQTYEPPPAKQPPPPDTEPPRVPDVEPAASGGSGTYAKARAAKEVYAAKLEQLKYEQQIGKLVELDSVGKAVEDAFVRVRQRLLAIPNAAAPELLGITTVGEAETVVAAYVREALEELVAAYG